jgi:putative DNA primase/helicase
MLAQIIRGDELVGLHRTYLDSNRPGKANVPSPKKSLKCDDSLSGGAIQLFEPHTDKPLVLVEGIETALAVHEYSGWPAWSGLNRILLEKVELPERVKSIIICGDKDESRDGQRSAEKLAQRLANDGKDVKVSLPPIGIPENSKSVDWLDFLTQEVTHVR